MDSRKYREIAGEDDLISIFQVTSNKAMEQYLPCTDDTVDMRDYGNSKWI